MSRLKQDAARRASVSMIRQHHSNTRKSSDTKSVRDPNDVFEYLNDILTELAELASDVDAETLSSLLEVAAREASLRFRNRA